MNEIIKRNLKCLESVPHDNNNSDEVNANELQFMKDFVTTFANNGFVVEFEEEKGGLWVGRFFTEGETSDSPPIEWDGVWGDLQVEFHDKCFVHVLRRGYLDGNETERDFEIDVPIHTAWYQTLVDTIRRQS